MDNFSTKDMSLQELIGIFPEAQKYLKKTLEVPVDNWVKPIPLRKDRIKKLKKDIEIIKMILKKTEDECLEIFEFLSAEIAIQTGLTDWEKHWWTTIGTHLFYKKPISQIENHLKQLKRQLVNEEVAENPRKFYSRVMPKHIEMAKQFPLQNFIKTNRIGVALCPFHSEKTPSFKINNDNTWHCFGCGLHGDVIDFVMRKNGLNFLETVKKLC